MLIYKFVENGNVKFSGDVLLSFGEVIDSLLGVSVLSPAHTQVEYLKLSAHDEVRVFMINDEMTSPNLDGIKEIIQNSTATILPVINKSLNDLKLSLELLDYKTNKEFNNIQIDYFAENNVYPLFETIAKPGLTTAQKVSSIVTLLTKINSNGNKLTIVDPFIFPKRYGTDYVTLFKDIIINSGVSEVEIITYRSNTDFAVRSDMEAAIAPIPMTVYDADTYMDHDRYWIIKKSEKMVHVGTSLNGLGQKLCSLTIQTKEDTRTVIKEISSITTTF